MTIIEDVEQWWNNDHQGKHLEKSLFHKLGKGINKTELLAK
jgi:hypothetical protein